LGEIATALLRQAPKLLVVVGHFVWAGTDPY